MDLRWLIPAVAVVVVLPACRVGVRRARLARSQANAHCLATARRRYVADHSGEWPKELEDLWDAGFMEESSREVLINPRQPDRAMGYVYLRPPKNPDPKMIMIHEAYEVWPKGGLVVVLADRKRTVLVLETDAELKQMLKAGRARSVLEHITADAG